MKTNFLFLAMMIGAMASARSQNPTIYPKAKEALDTSRIGQRGLGLYFTQIGAYSNPRGINARLREADYPELGNLQLFWGGGVQYRISDLQLGLELAHSVNPYGPRSNETSLVRRNALTIQLNACYIVYRPNDYLNFYPFLAAGGMETSVTLTRTSPDADFDNIIRQPGNAVSLTHFQSYFNVGVGADVIRRNLGWNYLVNLRAGYRLGQLDAWYSDYAKLDSAPRDRLSNFYVQMSIGFNSNWLSRRQKQY